MLLMAARNLKRVSIDAISGFSEFLVKYEALCCLWLSLQIAMTSGSVTLSGRRCLHSPCARFQLYRCKCQSSSLCGGPAIVRALGLW